MLAFTSALRKKELMRLALVDDLSFWTGLEAKQLARNLDVNVGSSNKPDVLKMLKPLYDEGRKYLTANGNLLLMRLRSELILKLRQQGTLGKLKITVLKSFAKRLGLDISQRISRRNLEKFLEKLMKHGVTAKDIAHQAPVSSKESVSEKQQDFTQCPVGALVNKVKSLTVLSSHGLEQLVVPHAKDATTKDDNVKSMLDGNATKPCTKSVLYKANIVDIAAKICSIFKTYNLHVTGIITLPDGNRYDRIFNVGGGNCYFYGVSQGLEFFGISMDHIQLRTRVGQWLQNPDNATFMETHLEIQPSGLYHHLKGYPAPPGGWRYYLNGMTWQDWGVHVELLGEWVGAMEITPTNHVLEEMGKWILNKKLCSR